MKKRKVLYKISKWFKSKRLITAAAFTLICLFSGITVYASDSSADQGGSGEGTGSGGSTISSERSGWMIYVTDKRGNLKTSDAVLFYTDGKPDLKVDKNVINSRVNGIKYSRTMYNFKYGAPLKNGSGQGNVVRNNLIKVEENGKEAWDNMISTLWGEEFMQQVVDEGHILILEPIFYYNIFVQGKKTEIVVLGTPNNIAEFQSESEYLNPMGDAKINRYTNGNFPMSAMLQQDKKVLEIPVPTTRNGKITNQQIMAEGYGMIAIWPVQNAIHTYNGVDSPGQSELTPKGVTNIVKSYHTVNKETGEDKDDGCYITKNVSSSIIIDDETEYKVEGWKVTDNTQAAKVPGNAWEPPGKEIEGGDTTGSVQIEKPGKTLYVLLKKEEEEEEEEIPEGIDYIINESQISKQVYLSEAETNEEGKGIRERAFTWRIPKLKNECGGHEYGSRGHNSECSTGCESTHTYTAKCTGWKVTDSEITVGLQNKTREEYPDILSYWYQNMRIGEEQNQIHNRGNNLEEGTKEYTGWDYKMVIHRGKDKLTIAEWKGLGLELGEITSEGYAIGNTPKGKRKTKDYSDIFSIGIEDNSTDRTTKSKWSTGSGHGDCGEDTQESELSNPITISPLAVLIRTYSGKQEGGTTDTTCKTEKMVTMGGGSTVKSGVMIPTGTNVGFYPYIEMRFDTLDGKDYPAYVVGQYRRSIAPNDYAEISWQKETDTNMVLSSQQWSTHAEATTGEGWRKKDTVLPAGAIMNLGIKKEDRQEVTVSTYQAIMEGEGRIQAEFAGEIEGMEEADAVSYHEEYVESVTQGLEGLSVAQYVDTNAERDTAFNGTKVESGSSLGDIGGGGKASTEDKYYFRGDVGTAQDGDIDTRQTQYNTQKYTFTSNTKGEILMNGSVILGIGEDESALSGTAQAINNRTYIVRKLIKAIERGTGEDSEAKNVGGTWYNEAFDGITIIVQTTVIETGMIDPSTRAAVLDVKLQPKNRGKSDLFSKAYISQFKMEDSTIYGEKEKVGIYRNRGGEKDVYMKDMEWLYRTKAFYIPNVNVQDIK